MLPMPNFCGFHRQLLSSYTTTQKNPLQTVIAQKTISHHFFLQIDEQND